MGVPEERKPGSGLDSGVAPGLYAFLLQSIPGQGGTEGRAAEGPGAGPLVGCLLSPFSGSRTAGWGRLRSHEGGSLLTACVEGRLQLFPWLPGGGD